MASKTQRLAQLRKTQAHIKAQQRQQKTTCWVGSKQQASGARELGFQNNWTRQQDDVADKQQAHRRSNKHDMQGASERTGTTAAPKAVQVRATWSPEMVASLLDCGSGLSCRASRTAAHPCSSRTRGTRSRVSFQHLPMILYLEYIVLRLL